jgi:hypothetical protein
VNATLARLGSGLGRLLQRPDRLEVEVGPAGPVADFIASTLRLGGGEGKAK